MEKENEMVTIDDGHVIKENEIEEYTRILEDKGEAAAMKYLDELMKNW